MELLYFISGVLSVGVLYGIKLLRSVKSSHTELLTRYQSQSNISSIRYAELNEDLKMVEDLTMDIIAKMEKENYSSITELNDLVNKVHQIANKNTLKLTDSNKVFNKNLADAFSEINTLKQNIKGFLRDPNTIDRY